MYIYFYTYIYLYIYVTKRSNWSCVWEGEGGDTPHYGGEVIERGVIGMWGALTI